jgi:anthranilate synthase/aminodeoxychorismate synthase-like glutamine amidotransferase
MKVLLIDHEDSFVYNIAQGLASTGAEVVTLRATRPLRDALRVDPDALVLSPGPGHPSDFRLTKMSRSLLRRWDQERPVLGICLGHQVIGEYYGGRVRRGRAPVHGEAVPIRHDGRGLFVGLPSPMDGARYHSLVVDRAGLPESLEVAAWDSAGTVMGLRHRTRAVDSVQFHPESYLSPQGPSLLANFLRGARR